jgi:hypothetical protein
MTAILVWEQDQTIEALARKIRTLKTLRGAQGKPQGAAPKTKKEKPKTHPQRTRVGTR